MANFELPFDKEEFLKEYNLQDSPLVFGYGSGVLPQAGYGKKDKPQVDLVAAVKNPSIWHFINMQRHPEEYTALTRTFHDRYLNFLQNSGAGIYYIPFIPYKNHQIKVGIISSERVLSDLRYWDTLYVAGRLQKPVLTVQDSQEITQAQIINMRNALRVALLKSEDSTNIRELCIKIAEISYTGDSRKWIGTDSSKAQKIVDKQEDLYGEMLLPYLKEVENDGLLIIGEEGIEQSKDSDVVQKLILSLPQSLEPAGLLNRQSDLSSAIDEKISSIVRAPSVAQTLKGLASAGLWKSGRYVAAKVVKALK